MQVSRQQPLNTVADSAPNHPDSTQFGHKPVQRALCSVVIGKKQHSFAWLEKSLDKFAITKGAQSGKRIVIVDSSSMTMLQHYTSGDSTLYQRLLDRDVTFVTSESIMNFVRSKYGTNPLPELQRNLRQVSFVDQGNADLEDILSAIILESLCPDYAFSQDKQLQRVAVVDPQSLIPIQPATIASSGKSQMPVSLGFELRTDTDDGCVLSPSSTVIGDIEFLQTLLNRFDEESKRPASIAGFSCRTWINYSFKEFGSAELAEELTGGVIQIADHLQQLPWFAMSAETEEQFIARGLLSKDEPLLGFGYGVRRLVRDLKSPADSICLQHCLDLRRSDLETCPATVSCFQSRCMLQRYMRTLFFNTQLRLFLQSLVRDLAKLSTTAWVHLCCSDDARLSTPEICQDAFDFRDCLALNRARGEFSLLRLEGSKTLKHDLSYCVICHMFDTDKLLPSFSSPLKDWNLQATEPYLRLFDNQESRSAMTLGKEHADILLSNASAILQLDAGWSLKCPPEALSSHAPALTDQSITGFKYGAVAGLADELFSFTPLPTRYTWLYNSGRGFLFGGQVGLALGLGEHIYLQYIEPVLPDGTLKACIRPVASNAFLAAALMQGQVLGVLGSVAGYAAVRNMGKMARYFWSRTSPRSEHTTNSD